MRKLSDIIAAAAVIGGITLTASVSAEEAPAQAVSSVAISGLRSPMQNPYRRLLSGIAVFKEKQSAMAPGADLRFVVLGKSRMASYDHLQVSLVGKECDLTLLTLDVSPQDAGFTVPDSALCEQEDAVLMVNRKQGEFQWWTRIRSPGLADNQFRFGDLRLASLINAHIQLSTLNRWIRAGITALPLAKTNWAVSDTVASARIVDGERVQLLTSQKFSNADGYLRVQIPLEDRHWSDEARIEFFDRDGRPAPARWQISAAGTPAPALPDETATR